MKNPARDTFFSRRQAGTLADVTRQARPPARRLVILWAHLVFTRINIELTILLKKTSKNSRTERSSRRSPIEIRLSVSTLAMGRCRIRESAPQLGIREAEVPMYRREFLGT